MAHAQKLALFVTLAIVGALALCFAVIPVVGNIRTTDTARILAGTVVVALAMAWACYFVTRAHFAQDEFKRQREISASFWGGWMGIAASAPIFFLIAVGGLGRLAAAHIPPLYIFVTGYLLPPVCGLIGTVIMRMWLRHRDSRQ